MDFLPYFPVRFFKVPEIGSRSGRDVLQNQISAKNTLSKVHLSEIGEGRSEKCAVESLEKLDSLG